MGAARDIRAGGAYVEAYLKDNQLVVGLRRTQQRLKAFSTNLKAIGRQLTVIGVMSATPFMVGTKVFADFEQQMANVSTMLTEPTAWMGEYTSEVKKMAVEFGESTETLTGGLYDILSASIPPAHALEVLAVSAKAAIGGMTDTKTSADAITTVLNSYGLEASRAADVSDWLFSVVRRGKTTFAELAPTIGISASIANKAGLSLNELGAYIATLTRAGVRTEMTMTAVNATMSAFLKPTDEAISVARRFGIEMNSTTLRTEGLYSVLKKISKLPPEVIAKIFPNIRAIKGMLPAVTNLEGYETDMGVMANRAGAAGVAYAKMANTLTRSFKRVWQVGMMVFNAIGEVLSVSVKKGADVIVFYSGIVIYLIDKYQELVLKAAKVVAVIIAVGGALITVGAIAAITAFVFGGIVSIFTALGGVIGGVTSLLVALISPVGLVVAAVAGLGTAIVYFSGAGGAVLDWLSKKFGELKVIATTAIGGISDAIAAGNLELAAEILWLSLKVIWQKGIATLNQAWLGAKKFFMDTVHKMWYGALAAAEITFHGLEVAWIETVSFLLNFWTKFTSSFKIGWETAVTWVEKRIHDLWGLLDKDYDTEGAKQLADDALNTRKSEIEQQKKKTLAEREQNRKTKRDKSKTLHDATLAVIGSDYAESKDKLDQAHDNKLTDAEKELNAAKEILRNAVAVAAKERNEGTDEDGMPTAENFANNLKNILDNLSRGVNAGDQARGTFNAAALQALQSTPNKVEDVAARKREEQLKALKKNAEINAKILEAVRDAAPVFI